NVYIYVSGGAPVRPASELAGCSALAPDKDPNSELFRIEVIQVPVAHPDQARVVSKPAILADLVEPHSHPEAAQDIARNDSIVAAARAQGAFIAKIRGNDRVVPTRVIDALLDGIVKARGRYLHGVAGHADVPKLLQDPGPADAAGKLRGAQRVAHSGARPRPHGAGLVSGWRVGLRLHRRGASQGDRVLRPRADGFDQARGGGLVGRVLVQ